ncbi:salivary glue protein Sgs-3-like [Artemia franciscana]
MLRSVCVFLPLLFLVLTKGYYPVRDQQFLLGDLFRRKTNIFLKSLTTTTTAIVYSTCVQLLAKEIPVCQRKKRQSFWDDPSKVENFQYGRKSAEFYTIPFPLVFQYIRPIQSFANLVSYAPYAQRKYEDYEETDHIKPSIKAPGTVEGRFYFKKESITRTTRIITVTVTQMARVTVTNIFPCFPPSGVSEPFCSPSVFLEPTTPEPTNPEPANSKPTTTEPLTPEPPSTEPPTTEPPTTEPLTKEPPTTEQPTTEISTIEPPTTKPPTTETTANEPPNTEITTTEPTTTEPTTTEPTTTEPPTTEPNNTEPSTTEQPTTERTTIEPPTTEPPTTKPPATEPSTMEPSNTEPPTIEQTTTKPPTTKPPTTEPSTTKPTTTKPPTTAQPNTEPHTAEPSTIEPTTAKPSTTIM